MKKHEGAPVNEAIRREWECPLGKTARRGALVAAVFAASLASAPAMATLMAFDLDRGALDLNALDRGAALLLLADERDYAVEHVADNRAVGAMANGLFLTTSDEGETDKTQGADGPGIEAAPVLATGIQVEVTGFSGGGARNDAGSQFMAKAHVVQMFRNHTGRWLDGDFRFPLPVGARLDGLEARVGGELVKSLPRVEGADELVVGEGPVVEPAAEVAASNVAEQTTALLDTIPNGGIVQDDSGLSVRLAEIEPGAVVAFVFNFSMPVQGTGDVAHLTVPPLAMPHRNAGQRIAEDKGADGSDLVRALAQTYLLDALPLPSVFDLLHSGKSAAMQIVLDTGKPLATLESPTHQFAAAMVDDALYRISLTGDPLPEGRAFVLRWNLRSAPQPATEPNAEPAPVLKSTPDGVSRKEGGVQGGVPAGMHLVGGVLSGGPGSEKANALSGYYYVPRLYRAGYAVE